VPKPHLIKRIAGIDPLTRADSGKGHVIISEKRDKKAAKYLVKDLPHPYTSRAQFERSMDTPLGVEWNTRVGFQRGTLPRIVKKVHSFLAVTDESMLTTSNVDGQYHQSAGKVDVRQLYAHFENISAFLRSIHCTVRIDPANKHRLKRTSMIPPSSRTRIVTGHG
jgi:hypothetical protein